MGVQFYIFIFLVANLVAVSLQAGEKIDVIKVIGKAIQAEVSKECSTCEAEVTILNKKILEDIAIPDRVIADQWKGQTNLVLELGDETRIVTADIRWKDKVLLAKNNIKIGDLINDENITEVERDVTFIKVAYSSQLDNVKGLVSKKLFRRGQILDETFLKKPIAIRFGQPLKIELENGELKLTMVAQARGAGAIGDDIPVYIPDTGKKLKARIVNESLVRVQ